MRVSTAFIEAPLVKEGVRIQIKTITKYPRTAKGNQFADHHREWRLTVGEARQVVAALTKAIQRYEDDLSNREHRTKTIRELKREIELKL